MAPLFNSMVVKKRGGSPFIYRDGSIEKWQSFYGSGRKKVRREENNNKKILLKRGSKER